jgi:uncharacterized protein YigA (DUF484 family)
MAGKAKDADARSDEAPGAEAVADYLRRHPDFLLERPDLVAALTPPTYHRGDGVVDLQRFMLESLRTEVEEQLSREARLLNAAEQRDAARAQVQEAALALLQSRSFEHLIRTVNERVAESLRVEAVRLCVESGDATAGARAKVGVVVIEPGTIDKWMRRTEDIALVSGSPGRRAIFGPEAAEIRSYALLRLSFGPKLPGGLLALGAADADGFHPRQGTELLDFLARVLEHCVRRWLMASP